MSRLIDANKVVKAILAERDKIPYELVSGKPFKHGNSMRGGIRKALRCIEQAPAVDAVPVVYCKDCKYADAERRNATEKRYADSILFCRNPDFCGDEPLAMWPVDFCSYGVAKECADDES